MTYPKIIAVILLILSVFNTGYCQIIQDTIVTDTLKSAPEGKVMFSTDIIGQLPVFDPGHSVEFRRWVHFELNKSGLQSICPVGMDINVKFIITSSGLVDDIRIENRAPIFSQAANMIPVGCINSIIKIFKDSEKYWTPGNHYGTPVSVQFSIAVTLR
jgi:hypothetical protein